MRRMDASNASRQARWRERQRQKAAAALAGDAADLLPGDTLAQVQAAILAPQPAAPDSALEAARAAFSKAIANEADALASRVVSGALGGCVTCLSLVTRSILPQVRTEERRISLPGLPPVRDLDGIAAARLRVAQGVTAGELGLADAKELLKVLATVEASLVLDEKRLTLSELRAALAPASGGPAGQVTQLAERAAELLALLPPEDIAAEGVEA